MFFHFLCLVILYWLYILTLKTNCLTFLDRVTKETRHAICSPDGFFVYTRFVLKSNRKEKGQIKNTFEDTEDPTPLSPKMSLKEKLNDWKHINMHNTSPLVYLHFIICTVPLYFGLEIETFIKRFYVYRTQICAGFHINVRFLMYGNLEVMPTQINGRFLSFLINGTHFRSLLHVYSEFLVLEFLRKIFFWAVTISTYLTKYFKVAITKWKYSKLAKE